MPNWTPRRGRSYKIPSVCMYVCMYVCLYVCNICPALTTPTILLIFGMKVGDHQSRNLTGPVFSEKFKIGVFWAFFVVPFLGCASDVTSLSKRQERMVILLMFLYSDQCGGFCVCNIMSRMSGHVYPQSFMILNVFTIMFDLVHMQSQSFQMIFQSLMTSYQSVILSFSAQGTGFHLEMGLLFCVILLFNRGEPLSQFF